jgi:hypothetical protein
VEVDIWLGGCKEIRVTTRRSDALQQTVTKQLLRQRIKHSMTFFLILEVAREFGAHDVIRGNHVGGLWWSRRALRYQRPFRDSILERQAALFDERKTQTYFFLKS